MCYVLCIVCYVLCIVQHVCISCVLSIFLELCLGLENFLKVELLILHWLYNALCVSQRCNDHSAADLEDNAPGPWEGVGGG